MDNQELLFKISSIVADDMPRFKIGGFIICNIYLNQIEKGIVFKDNNLLKTADDYNKNIANEKVRRIKQIINELSKEEISELVESALLGRLNFGKDFTETSNDGIAKIVFNLLDIDDSGHIVYDMGSGNGYFLWNVINECRKNNIVLKDVCGQELNADEAVISQMAFSILVSDSIKPFIKIGNALEGIKYPYTKGFVFPPINARVLMNETSRKSRLYKDIEFTNRNTGEWIFIDQLLSEISGQWTAVALVSGRALFSDADKEYRDRLIANGLLKAIVELPNGALSYTGIKTYLLVFSEGNDKVGFADASNVLDDSPKRFNKVELPVDKIIDLYRQKLTYKDLDELKTVNNLIPSSVLIDVDKIKNGKALSKIAEVFTGNQYTLGVFEKNGMLSDIETGYRILTSSDIEDGIVAWKKLQSIVYNDDKFDKYAVKKNDVIVTSKSSKVKTVVVDIEPKEKIIVTGGMIIIRPDIDKIDPTYLKIFLDSEQGQNALKKIQKGSTIVSINSKDLSTILVPLIEIDKQREKAYKYNERLSTIYAYKMEVKKLEESLKNIFLEEEDE